MKSKTSLSSPIASSADDRSEIADDKKPGGDPRLLVNILGGDSLDKRDPSAMSQFLKRKKKRRSGNAIGATRVKLAKIVSESLGIDCQPEDLKPATGANRTNKALDIYAWEVFARRHNGVPFVAGAFETMTECVKAGKVYIHKGEIYSGEQGK